MENSTDNPNVIASPPLIFLSGLLIGGIVSQFYYPFALLPGIVSIVLGIILIIAGVGIILTAWQQMRKAKTNIDPCKPTTAILDEGLYAVSRNPIYLAMSLIYLGVTFLFNSVWLLLFLPLVLVVMCYGVIFREEKYLEDKFGEVYLNYKNRVRRWI